MRKKTVRNYKKNPLIVEAMLFEIENLTEAVDFVGSSNFDIHDVISIKTLEGWMTLNPGDYIVKGIEGEFYPCKKSIFEKTYTEVGEEPGTERDCHSCILSVAKKVLSRDEPDRIVAKYMSTGPVTAKRMLEWIEANDPNGISWVESLLEIAIGMLRRSGFKKSS